MAPLCSIFFYVLQELNTQRTVSMPIEQAQIVNNLVLSYWL